MESGSELDPTEDLPRRHGGHGERPDEKHSDRTKPFLPQKVANTQSNRGLGIGLKLLLFASVFALFCGKMPMIEGLA